MALGGRFLARASTSDVTSLKDGRLLFLSLSLGLIAIIGLGAPCYGQPENHLRAIGSSPKSHVRSDGVLIVPGLNLAPDRLTPFANIARKIHQNVAIVTLSEAPNGWENDLVTAVLRARQQSERIHLIGFSLGGLLSFNYAMRFPDQIASLTLIAPPIWLRPIPAALMALLPFLPAGMPLPSANDQRYRLRDSVSVAEYRELQEQIDIAVASLSMPVAASLPLTVIVSTHDPLVSAGGVEVLVSHLLPSAERVVLRRRGPDPDLSGHLIIDSASVAQEDWQIVVEAILRRIR